MNTNKNGNFVKIDRKIVSWGWYTDISTKCLFLHCILQANWKPGEWKGIRYGRGQFITSLGSLSRETGLSIQQIRTAIKRLESTGEITKQTTSKFTIITVKNYDLYQSDNRVVNNQSTSKQQSANKRATNNQQQYKKEKNNKEGKKAAAPKNCPLGVNPDYDPEPGTDFMYDYYKQRGGY